MNRGDLSEIGACQWDSPATTVLAMMIGVSINWQCAEKKQSSASNFFSILQRKAKYSNVAVDACYNQTKS